MSEGALSLWQHLTSPRVLLLSIVPLPCLSVSTLGRGGGPVSLRVSPFGEESTTFFRLNFSGGSKLGCEFQCLIHWLGDFAKLRNCR